jgi:hypothetical protein
VHHMDRHSEARESVECQRSVKKVMDDMAA